MVCTQAIHFWEGDVVAKTVGESWESQQAYLLRHKVFCQTLKWVSPSEDDQEIDPYDAWATSVGLFSGSGNLLGICRLIVSPAPFMLEKDFRSCLLPGYSIRKERDTAEITRLALDPSIQDKGLSSRMMLLLLKAAYQWTVINDIRYLYLVVEKRFLRVLRTIGFPCEQICPGQPLPPAGVVSVAAILDLERFRREAAVQRPEFLDWITSIHSERKSEAVEVTAGHGASIRAGRSGTGKSVPAGYGHRGPSAAQITGVMPA